MNAIRKAWNHVLDLFNEEDSPDEPIFDPVHVAAVIVGCIAGLGVVYWLLWSLLVCEGGLFGKVGPLFQVVFTSKTLKDFGYEGYPYELGIFEGWIVNGVALVLTLAAITAIWHILERTKREDQ